MKTLITFIIFIFICCLMYGSFWLGKKISYELMYEDMVKQTIIETVKEEALKL